MQDWTLVIWRFETLGDSHASVRTGSEWPLGNDTERVRVVTTTERRQNEKFLLALSLPSEFQPRMTNEYRHELSPATRRARMKGPISLPQERYRAVPYGVSTTECQARIKKSWNFQTLLLEWSQGKIYSGSKKRPSCPGFLWCSSLFLTASSL